MRDPVRFEELHAVNRRRIAVVTLDAEKRLNALSLRIVSAIEQHLARWRDDDRIALVVLHAASERAFCAGGDLREMYAAETASPKSLAADGALGSPYVRTFFEHEYRLDYALHTYPKPVLCWGHGIIMGGGLGLLVGCSHRVVTESAQLSMPEIAIGHFPDVAGTWFLDRMPGKTGLFAALTGAALGAEDAVHAKLADYCIPHSEKHVILDALLQQAWNSSRHDNDIALGRVLHSRQWSRGAMERPLLEYGDLVSELCSRPSLEEIYAGILALKPSPDPWLQAGAHRLAQGYAGSAGLIYALLRRGSHGSLADIFRLEYRVAICSVLHGQFMEGIRALIIDKDRRPRWDRTIEAVTPEWIEQTFLAPLPAGQDPLADLESSASHPDAKTWT